MTPRISLLCAVALAQISVDVASDGAVHGWKGEDAIAEKLKDVKRNFNRLSHHVEQHIHDLKEAEKDAGHLGEDAIGRVEAAKKRVQEKMEDADPRSESAIHAWHGDETASAAMQRDVAEARKRQAERKMKAEQKQEEKDLQHDMDEAVPFASLAQTKDADTQSEENTTGVPFMKMASWLEDPLFASSFVETGTAKSPHRASMTPANIDRASQANWKEYESESKDLKASVDQLHEFLTEEQENHNFQPSIGASSLLQTRDGPPMDTGLQHAEEFATARAKRHEMNRKVWKDIANDHKQVDEALVQMQDELDAGKEDARKQMKRDQLTGLGNLRADAPQSDDDSSDDSSDSD